MLKLMSHFQLLHWPRLHDAFTDTGHGPPQTSRKPVGRSVDADEKPTFDDELVHLASRVRICTRTARLATISLG